MSEIQSNSAKETSSKGLSPIWFVPLAALLIAGWLAFQSWQDKGPDIYVTFDHAAGIDVGKTTVKYRDVVIGKVKQVSLSDDFDKVIVHIAMVPKVKDLISKDTQFWVVAPRISLRGVSGLSTMLSGVYIEMDPGEAGKFESEFTGLPAAPAFRSYDRGTTYRLYAQRLNSLDIGSPVYHRDVKVGWVSGYDLDEEKQRVNIRFFVESPYDSLVHTDCHFWNVSGFNVNFGAEGLETQLASVASLVSGGLTFECPVRPADDMDQAVADTEFYLFPDKKSVVNGTYTVAYPYVLRFDGSIRGLKLGAPVEYNGVKVGEVTHISLIPKEKEAGLTARVLISLQPERVDRADVPSWETLNEVMLELAQLGLRAQLKVSSLLTGALYVDLTPDAAEVDKALILADEGIFKEIPTSDTQIQQLSKEIAETIEQIRDFPIGSIGNSLEQSLNNLSRLTATIEPDEFGEGVSSILKDVKKATTELDTLVGEFNNTLKSVDQAVAADSKFYNEAINMMDDISAAATSFQILTEKLNRYPNSLVVGGGEQK